MCWQLVDCQAYFGIILVSITSLIFLSPALAKYSMVWVRYLQRVLFLLYNYYTFALQNIMDYGNDNNKPQTDSVQAP